MKLAIWVGTRKGAFVFRSANRKTWRAEGPFFRGMEVNHVAQDRREPSRLYAAVNSAWFGPHIHASTDGGKSWKLSEAGLELKSIPGGKLARAWRLEPGHADEPGTVYAGFDPGALFRSRDWGQSWEEVASINAHTTRERWQAGAGGMCLHSIQCLGQGRLILAISAAGAFRSTDSGATWQPHNVGVRADFLPDKYPEVGQCVHKLLAHPANPDLLFQQNHCGVYRSRFGGKKWTDISRGLPSRFGFCLAAPASEPETLFTIPHEGAEFRCNLNGRLQVARSRDGGKNWTLLSKGLPQRDAYVTVLREAMASDSASPAGVYFGSANGRLYYTRDAGNSWQTLADNLPPVYSVSVAEG
ncbi:MAG: exo-alpha-sialidase [Acidobacteria bacterium]|nr:exo-alpha-sialidase [Acidobacteriota bacterium]MBI3470227.1 exo-alpha-sialidase [Candidatus Solibacter usitatus]